MNHNMKKIFFILFGILFLIIMFLFTMKMLGYNFNKKFLSFNRQQCINDEFSTSFHHSGIEGCMFWMRHNFLEKEQNWQSLFKRDNDYCNQKYKNKNTWDSLNGEYADPKCNYDAFRGQKREENWNYLVSKEQDGFYNYCVDQVCPRQTIFK